MPVTPLLSILCKELQQNLLFTATPTLYLAEKESLPYRDGVGGSTISAKISIDY
jgi:hypothetical protein